MFARSVKWIVLVDSVSEDCIIRDNPKSVRSFANIGRELDFQILIPVESNDAVFFNSDGCVRAEQNDHHSGVDSCGSEIGDPAREEGPYAGSRQGIAHSTQVKFSIFVIARARLTIRDAVAAIVSQCTDTALAGSISSSFRALNSCDSFEFYRMSLVVGY